MLTTIDHIGVAVDDLDAALALYRNALAMPLVHRETVSDQGVEAVLLDVGDSHVELREALGSTGWHDVSAEDGTVAIALGSVVYVIVAHEEHRVGFGIGS